MSVLFHNYNESHVLHTETYLHYIYGTPSVQLPVKSQQKILLKVLKKKTLEDIFSLNYQALRGRKFTEKISVRVVFLALLTIFQHIFF